jgi:hypothetical protein
VSDEPSVLGNLPRSRAANRSPRRAGGTPAEPTPRPAAGGREPAVTEGEAVSDVVRAAGRAAGAVLGAASRAAGGVLGRIPRP